MKNTITAAAWLLVSCSLWAQMTRGVLVGTVSDPSGAYVAGVPVNITEEARNTTVRVVTNSNGQYTATNLEPGTYRVAVEAPGFKAAAVEHIVLNVNQTARVDVRLDVGEMTSSVSVQATAPVGVQEHSDVVMMDLFRR